MTITRMALVMPSRRSSLCQPLTLPNIPSIGAQKLHTAFGETLKKIKPTENTLKLYKEILFREANNQLGRLNINMKRYRDELNDIASLRQQAIQKFTAGELTLGEKNELIDALEKRKLDTGIKLKELEQHQAFREADIDRAINFMEHVDQQWAIVDFDARQRFQELIFPSGLVYDHVAHRFGTKKISPLYRSISREGLPGDEIAKNDNHMVAGAGLSLRSSAPKGT